MRLLALSIPFLVAAGLNAGPPAARTPVVVELFTSQGCSSCPPADAYLEELARRPDVVAITRPVTYWDRLGWKDTLAREDNTALQRSYAAKGGEGSGVYTPQTVVQGQFGTVGSRRGTVAQQIATAHKTAGAAIAVRPGLVAVDGKGAPAEVRLLDIRSSANVRIGSGENGGRTIRYTNVVVGERVIGTWQGGAKTFAVTAPMTSGADKRAVIVQKSGAGAILAASWL